MSIPRPSVANLYNPKTQSREALIEQFLLRQRIFGRLFLEIRESKMDTPEQHILIEGKRGMGKTTLLFRLTYEIEEDQELNSWLVPLVFNEEEYGVRKLYKLWERILELLMEKLPSFSILREKIELLSQESPQDENYERALFRLLSKHLQEAQRKVILFIDNFGGLFQKFSKSEAHRLRKVLQTSADLRIIAASDKPMEAFYDYKHPFYEFFKIEKLESLSAEDTRHLLFQMGEQAGQEKIKFILEHQKGRVEALRRLTGGVVRTMILIYEIFVDEGIGNAFADLEKILDRLTPFYKHRMDDLPAQQQEIVETIALHWDAVSVKEIAKRTRMESKVISAQLHQLVKNQVVDKIHTGTKNHFYQISERLFNIWYLMRNGRKHHRSKVLWLVHFLEEWCGGKMESLPYSTYLAKEEIPELPESTRDYLQAPNSQKTFRQSAAQLELQAQARSALKSKQYQKALGFLLKLRKKDNFLIAYTYHKGLGDFAQAEKYYLAAATQQNHAAAYNNLGVLYQYQLHQPQQAEKYFQKAVEQKNSKAMYNLAQWHKRAQKDFGQAEKYYQMAIAAGDKDAPFQLADMYVEELQKPRLAEQVYQEVALAEESPKAMYQLAQLNHEVFYDPEQAAYYFRSLIEHSLYESDDLVQPVYTAMIYLMARGDFDFLETIFEDKKAKELHWADRFKPVYYTLMYLLQDRHPKAYLRMGSELKETVKEIIEEVQRLDLEFEKEK